jgi:hypothetical protein
MSRLSDIRPERETGALDAKLRLPLVLSAGIATLVWVLAWLLAPEGGCFTEDQRFPAMALYGLIAIAAFASGVYAWYRRRSIRAIVGHAIVAALVAVPLLWVSLFSWFVVNGCPLSTR